MSEGQRTPRKIAMSKQSVFRIFVVMIGIVGIAYVVIKKQKMGWRAKTTTEQDRLQYAPNPQLNRKPNLEKLIPDPRRTLGIIGPEENKTPEEEEHIELSSRWAESFPFTPEYHSNLFFEPEMYNPAILDSTQVNWEGLKLVENHGFLRRFYESPVRLSQSFEAMYRVFEGAGVEVNPLIMGWTYNALRDYHQSRLHDPNEVIEENSRFDIWTDTGLVSEFRDRTRADEMDSHYEIIVGNMIMDRNYLPNETSISQETAEHIRSRLLNEIPAEGFIESNDGFTMVDKYETELKPGDPLLIR
jgi:hypothetical protein